MPGPIAAVTSPAITAPGTLGGSAGTGPGDCTNGDGPSRHCINAHCNSDADCGNVANACNGGVPPGSCAAGTQPAAIAWWTSLGLLTAMCVRGVFVRNRDRMFALAGLGATALVGVHSMFDFSLQIPAVALFYSVILGLGVAQSLPSHLRDER